MQNFFKELTSYIAWPMIVVFAYLGLIEGYEPAKNIALFAGYFLFGVAILLSPFLLVYYSNEQFSVSIEELQNALKKKNKLRSLIKIIGIVVFSVICVIKGYFLVPVMASVSVFLVKLVKTFASERLEIELAKQNDESTKTVTNLAN